MEKLRAMELDENVYRKDLTQFELDRRMVEKAEKVKPAPLAQASTGGRAKKAKPDHGGQKLTGRKPGGRSAKAEKSHAGGPRQKQKTGRKPEVGQDDASLWQSGCHSGGL
jgi:hypothetical protein